MRAAWVTAVVGAGVLLGAGGVSAETKAVRALGFLTEQADQRCLEGGKVEWLNPHAEVGFTRVVDSDVPLAPLYGKAVLVTGTAVEAPKLVVENTGPCPMVQMRSDWVEGRDGIRVQRGGGAGVAALHVTAVEEWDGLAAKVDGKSLVVTLKKDLGAPVDVTVHYEGCYGKPGSTARTEKAAKAGAVLRFPLAEDETYDQPRKGMDEGVARHVPVAITLDGTAPGLVLGLDLPLRALGVTVSCPDRQ